MKRILFFMATLLLSAGAFAQNVNSNTRVYGDVNGDGVVNINDVVAVVNIILTPEYFYLGTTQPTANNYKSLLGVETSYTSIDNAVGTVVPIAAGETLYMMCPVSWMDGKGVELEDISGNTINFMEEKDVSTISGYVIYKTQVLNDVTELTLKIREIKYYFSIGTTPITADNYTTANDATTTIPTTMEYTGSQRAQHYILIPSNKTIIVTDKTLGSPFTLVEQTNVNISNHKLYKTQQAIANGGTVIIQLS